MAERLRRQYWTFGGHEKKRMIKYREDEHFGYYYCPWCGSMLTYHIGVHGVTPGKWKEDVFQRAVDQGLFTPAEHLREKRAEFTR